ncbi:MAG: hypothetical protein ABEJ65_11525 [bacterium]
MIPFYLLFYPPGIFKTYPVRNWREVTLFLKWGLLLSLFASIIRIIVSGSRTSISWIFWGIAQIVEYNDAIQGFPFILKMALFFIITGLIVVFVWLIKSLIIMGIYQVLGDDVVFTEPKIAMSIAAASMITNIWYMVPIVGPYFACFHGAFLVGYLAVSINRLPLQIAIPVSIVGLIPITF